MKVLHVYRTYFPDTQGGLEEVIRQICLNTLSHGIESRVFTLSDNPAHGAVMVDSAQVHQARQHFEIASCSISLTAMQEFKRQVEWADIINYHFPWPFADYLHLLGCKNKTTVVTYHSDIVRQRLLRILYEPIMKRFLNSVNRIVCTSPNYFATSEVLHLFEHKTDVIPIGLSERSTVVPDPSKLADMEAKFGRDFFLFVGVLRYYKGLHILLESIKDAPYQVIVVGSGPTERDLKRQARELQLTNVTFAGYLPDEDKNSLFQLCRGVVFPSYMRSEAFGVTLLEGAMHGKPMISTEVGSGTSHVNVHDQTGFVIAPSSRKSLRFALDQLWFRPELAQLMGQRARSRYERLFSGTLMGTRYASLYRELLGQNAQSEVDTKTNPHVAVIEK